MLQEGDKAASHGTLTKRRSALRLLQCFVSLFPQRAVQLIAVECSGHNHVLTDLAAITASVLDSTKSDFFFLLAS